MLSLVFAAALTAQPAIVDVPVAPVDATAQVHHPRFRKGVWIGLLSAGGGVIALSWVVTALVWVGNSRIGYLYAAEEPAAWSFIPVVGPWISLSERRANFTLSSDEQWRRAMMISGTIQAVGAGMMALAVILKSQTLPGRDPADEPAALSWGIEPLVGPGVGGLQVSGRF